MPFISAAFLSAWQVKQRARGVVVISLTRVTSLLTRISWQEVQPIAIAEWTDLPLVLSSWQAMQVEVSALGSSGTGCFAAETRPARSSTTMKQPNAFSFRFIRELGLSDFNSTPTAPSSVACARISPYFFNLERFWTGIVTDCNTIS